MLCWFSQLVLPVPSKSKGEVVKIQCAFRKWKILNIWTWNQLEINTWEIFNPVLPISVRKKKCIYAVVPVPLLFSSNKDGTRTIFYPAPLKCPLSSHFCESELSGVYAQHECCISQHLISEGLCSVSCSEQAYKLRQSEVLGHRWAGSWQWWCSCKLPTSPLEPHALVSFLALFMPYWTQTVSWVTAELLWSSQSSTAGQWSSRKPLQPAFWSPFNLRFISPVVSVDFSTSS